MNRTPMLMFAACSAILPLAVIAQTPATPTTLPSTATVADTPGVRLRSLPAVLDARERQQDWHKAADAAASRIQDPGLKAQYNQRMAGLVPNIAKLLLSSPHDYAVVTVAVYREPNAPDKQAMLGVTVDGLDSQLGSDFFADVVAGLPQPPTGEGIPAGLTLDTEATSYLVFFLGDKQLEAGDIPHTVFGKSILIATNKARSDSSPDAIAAQNAERASERRAAQSASAQNTNTANQGQTVNGGDGYVINGGYPEQQAGYVTSANPYGYASNYPLANDGYYYPGVGVPVVILPGESQTTQETLQHQVEREHRLEHAYQERHSHGMPDKRPGRLGSLGNGRTAENGNARGNGAVVTPGNRTAAPAAGTQSPVVRPATPAPTEGANNAPHATPQPVPAPAAKPSAPSTPTAPAGGNAPASNGGGHAAAAGNSGGAAAGGAKK